MNIRHLPSTSSILRPLIGGLALAAVVSFVTTGTAQAAVTAKGAKIFNVVKVDYKDASGTSSFVKSADVTVTVDLKQASPSVYFALANGVAGSTTSATSATGVDAIDSGSIQDYSFWLYSNANGSDSYALTLGDGSSADTNFVVATPAKTVFSYTDASGAAVVAPLNQTIGATMILGNAVNSDTVSIAYNTLNGIAVDDYVVIVSGLGVPTMYKVRAVNDGVTPSRAANAKLDETNGWIQLYQANGSTAADLGASDSQTGLVISEVLKATAQVTAVADDLAAADADIYLKVDLRTTALGATYNANKDDIKTTFKRSQLLITKGAAPLLAQPGATVTYTISVHASAADATSVKVTDAVPVYTTLLTDAYGAGLFARVRSSLDDGANYGGWSTLTTGVNADNADVSGDAAGTAAGSLLTFFLGTGNDGTTGGDMVKNRKIEIEYKVQVD